MRKVCAILVVILWGCGAAKGGGANDEPPWAVIEDLDPGQTAGGFLSVDGEVFTALSAVAYYNSYDPYRPHVAVVDHPNASCDTPVICNSCSQDEGFFSWTRDPEEPYPTRNVHIVDIAVHDADFDPETDQESAWLADTIDESQILMGYIYWGEDVPEGVEWSSEVEAGRSDDMEAVLDPNALPSYRGRITGFGEGALRGFNEEENQGIWGEFEFDISFDAPLCGTNTVGS
jgi:hypothetical protein